MTIRGTTITTPMKREAVVDDTTISKKPWSSQNMVEKFCPPIAESGYIVACDPIEGYPLTVTAELDKSPLIYRCGKNLFDASAEIAQRTYGDTTRWGYLIELPAGTYTVHLEHKGEVSSNYVYAYHYDADGASKGSAQLSNSTTLKTWTFTMAEGDKVYIVHGKDQSQTAARNVFAKFNIQIEVGGMATAYEPHRVPDVFAPGDTIPILSGKNTIWADNGNITVTGRADPITIIERLTLAIIALGANI